MRFISVLNEDGSYHFRIFPVSCQHRNPTVDFLLVTYNTTATVQLAPPELLYPQVTSLLPSSKVFDHLRIALCVRSRPPQSSFLVHLVHIRTMSNSQGRPWSDNPSAPKTPYLVYVREKGIMAGNLVNPVLHGTSQTPTHAPTNPCSPFVLLAPGILIMLSFQYMAALFSPVHRRGKG